VNRETRPCRLRPTDSRLAAFTLVEMMVVVTILLLAFGLMVPSLAEFFKNRALDAVSAQITSAFGTARMQAVVNGRPFHVVFFREGVRIYDEKRQTWRADEVFDPAEGPFADSTIHFDLFFAGKHSDQLPRYDDFARLQKARAAREAERLGRRSRAGPGEEYEKISIQGLVSVVFERDGSLHLVAGGGNDVPSAQFRQDPPVGADIVIWQKGNGHASFVDLQPTGTVKSKVAMATEVHSQREEKVVEEKGEPRKTGPGR
jgi:type II secretory pathway pseudopilin PulG